MHANFREVKIWKMIILELMKCIKCFIHWEESGDNIWSFEACIDLSSLHTRCPAFQYWCRCSVTKLHPTLCDPMDYSTPGFPVLHYLSEFAQTHAHHQLSWWCHPTISSSFTHFSSCPQSFLAPGTFQMRQLFTSGGQSVGVSASASVLPKNSQDLSPL